MARKRYTPEQIIGMLREAEVRLSQGEKIGAIARSAGISEQRYYRWRREYGGPKVSQAKRLEDLEKENQRLCFAVSPDFAAPASIRRYRMLLEQETNILCLLSSHGAASTVSSASDGCGLARRPAGKSVDLKYMMCWCTKLKCRRLGFI